MSTVNETVANYIAAWNETDNARRTDIVARTWTEDGGYIDGRHDVVGHEAISAMIGAVQNHFAGYRFRLASGIEAVQDRIRFSWHAGGTQEAPLFFAGTDFAAVAPDGRLRMVTGFIDAMPILG